MHILQNVHYVHTLSCVPLVHCILYSVFHMFWCSLRVSTLSNGWTSMYTHDTINYMCVSHHVVMGGVTWPIPIHKKYIIYILHGVTHRGKNIAINFWNLALANVTEHLIVHTKSCRILKYWLHFNKECCNFRRLKTKIKGNRNMHG